MTKGLPKIDNQTMLWGGSRPYNTKNMALKLGEDNFKMYFEFYSKAGGQEHWGKSDHLDLRLGTKA
jgi:hypothetical protein